MLSWLLAGVINSSNRGSTQCRNGPDAAANANYICYVCAEQTVCTANEYGGTRCATGWDSPNGTALISTLAGEQSPARTVSLRQRPAPLGPGLSAYGECCWPPGAAGACQGYLAAFR
jgi:hypothetical protein